MAANGDEDALRRAVEQRQARAEAAERRRAVSARSAYSAVEEMVYADVDAAVQAGSVIGEGAYGPVYCCRLDGRRVAVKVGAANTWVCALRGRRACVVRIVTSTATTIATTNAMTMTTNYTTAATGRRRRAPESFAR